MPDNQDVQLNHDVAVAALFSIRDEARINATSGDVRIAGDARRDYLLASVCLLCIGAIGKEAVDNAEYPNLPAPNDLDVQSETVTPAPAPVNPNPAIDADGNPVTNAPAQPQTADQLASQTQPTDDIISSMAPQPSANNSASINNASETNNVAPDDANHITADDLSPTENTTADNAGNNSGATAVDNAETTAPENTRVSAPSDTNTNGEAVTDNQ